MDETTARLAEFEEQAMICRKRFRAKLQARLAEVQSEPAERKAGALAMLDAAEQAHRKGREDAPRLMLDALEYRIREIDAGPDSLAAAKRIAVETDDTGIEAGYRGVMWFERDARRDGGYHQDDWQMCWDIAEIIICSLDVHCA